MGGSGGRILAIGVRQAGENRWPATLIIDGETPEIVVVPSVANRSDVTDLKAVYRCDAVELSDGVVADMAAADLRRTLAAPDQPDGL